MLFFSEAGLNTVRVTMFKNFTHHLNTMKKIEDGQFLPTQLPFIRQTSIKISIPFLTNETHPELLLRAPASNCRTYRFNSQLKRMAILIEVYMFSLVF
jgi:hypothetical protein